jgi:hypothetical protein
MLKGIIKTHKLVYEESEVLVPKFRAVDCIFKWTISSKLLLEHLAHFHPRLEEITMKCRAESVEWNSYLEELAEDRKGHEYGNHKVSILIYTQGDKQLFRQAKTNFTDTHVPRLFGI